MTPKPAAPAAPATPAAPVASVRPVVPATSVDPDGPAGPAWPAPLFAVDPLVMEASGGRIVVSSPRLSKRLRVVPPVAAMLLAARAGIDPAEYPAGAVDKLVEAGFLLAERQASGAPVPWDGWGTTAWSFHNRNRDTPFVVADAGQVATYRERISARPRPSSVRPPCSDRVLLLPRVRTALDLPYRDVLERRRTHRSFVDAPVELDMFSDMLHYCFAPLRFADAGEMGVLQLRANASAGARHETEAFVLVLNVSNVDPGLYHYDNIRHGLELIRPDVGRDHAEHLTHGQGFFRTAAFGVLTAAVADRMSWKYPHPRAYKMLLHNVGHVAQVFSMTATALGLGAALTGAIRDSEADALLGLDQPREFTTFALACGHPERGTDGMPASVRVARAAPGRN
ncbi:MAG TPA: SagB/ThcOx family dehydrogenase [Micromonosporaceae bacterium]|nr:SagB/ThcOx family dehydrogenase [Micromonosporaceae bacterium]